MLRNFSKKRVIMRVCEKKLMMITELYDKDRRYKTIEKKKETCENKKKPVKNDNKK
jgi:hypothetical protein